MRIPIVELAERITLHLKKIGDDPREQAVLQKTGGVWCPAAIVWSHRYIKIWYTAWYDAPVVISYVEAMNYLEWLDAGNAGVYSTFLQAQSKPVAAVLLKKRERENG